MGVVGSTCAVPKPPPTSRPETQPRVSAVSSPEVTVRLIWRSIVLTTLPEAHSA